MKRVGLVAVALASVGVLLAACAPPKQPPPPPPTDPHDVLVVGDSIAYSFGCVLGDSTGGAGPCPAPSGSPPFTTQNEIVGGCTISGGTILLYNGITTDTPGCGDWPTSWAEHADKFVPKVVVIVTSGWEIMDRWSGGPSGVPDRQWGGGNPSAASSAYQANLAGAINLFRSRGSKVIVANSAYMNPPEPQFPPGTPGAPDFIIRAWYERYPVTNTTQPPEIWEPAVAGLTYRPSKTKVEQFNNAITSTVSSFGDPANVLKFDFFKHFSPTINGSPAYSDSICPPPNDGADPSTCAGTAIDARDADGGHLTSAGGHSILAHYLVPCVRAVLAGNPPTACS